MNLFKDLYKDVYLFVLTRSRGRIVLRISVFRVRWQRRFRNETRTRTGIGTEGRVDTGAWRSGRVRRHGRHRHRRWRHTERRSHRRREVSTLYRASVTRWRKSLELLEVVLLLLPLVVHDHVLSQFFGSAIKTKAEWMIHIRKKVSYLLQMECSNCLHVYLLGSIATE